MQMWLHTKSWYELKEEDANGIYIALIHNKKIYRVMTLHALANKCSHLKTTL